MKDGQLLTLKSKKFVRCGAHLPVKNLRKTLDYYKNKLGFTDEWIIGEKDGGVSRDDMRMIFAEHPTLVHDMNTNTHRLPLIWFVDNIEKVYEEFQNRHIEFADHLKTHSYGLREFAFIDINGYYIRVAEGVEKYPD